MNRQSKRTSSPTSRATFAILLILAIAIIIGLIELLRHAPTQPTSSAPQIETSSNSFPRAVSDASGNRLTINAPPQRIISQTLGSDEILLAITDAKRIIGFSPLVLDPKYSNVVEQARANGSPPVQNAEEILQLNPDLIFVASYSRAETVEQLQAARAPVFRFANFDRIEDIKNNILAVGYAVGEDEQAKTLINEMDERLAAVRARIPANTVMPRVLSYGVSGHTAGANTLFDDIVRHAGGINVVAEHGIDGFPKISAEQVLAWQPDFIVINGDPNNESLARQQLLSNPAIAATNAARANRIIFIETRYFLAVSHHIVRTVELLADKLYEPTPQ